MAGVAASIAAPRLAISAAPSLGVTLPLTGVQAEVARELEVGYRLAAGESGLDLRILDDESSPAKVAANVRQLGADPNVLALSGIVGTPHAQAGLDAAKDVGLPVVGTSKSPALTGLGLVSAFPLPRIGADLRKRYRMALSAGGMPSVLNESVTAFEGYFYGTVAASAALGAGTRDGLLRKLHGGVSVGELRIDFSKAMVGYQYLEFLLKSRDGLLRA